MKNDMTENELIKKYQQLSLRDGDELILSRENTLSLVSDCEKKNIGILGFDGVRVANDSIVPDMSAIADFSTMFEEESDWGTMVRKSIEASRKFVESISDKEISFIPTLNEKQ